MSKQKKIYLLRHGQTDWNKEGRIQGHLEVPLNEVGREESRRLMPVLERLGVEKVLSSDLSRAIETARLAAPKLGHLTDARLRETHLGVLQGKTRDEIHAEHGDEIWERLRSFPLQDSDVMNLGTESGSQVFSRTEKAILDFVSKHEFQVAAIVTHGGVLRNLFRFLKITEIIPHPIPNAALFPFSWSETSPTALKYLETNPFASVKKPGRF